MEKKYYKKPEIIKTDLDYSITLTQSSNDPVPPPPDTINPPNEIFINPIKWFK